MSVVYIILRQEDIGIDNVSTWEDKMEAKSDKMEAQFARMEATLNKILEVLEVVTRQRALNSAVETPPETPPVSRVRRLIPSTRAPATPSEFRHRFQEKVRLNNIIDINNDNNEYVLHDIDYNMYDDDRNIYNIDEALLNRNDSIEGNSPGHNFDNNDEHDECDDDTSECYDLDEIYGSRNDIFEGHNPGYNVTNTLSSIDRDMTKLTCYVQLQETTLSLSILWGGQLRNSASIFLRSQKRSKSSIDLQLPMPIKIFDPGIHI